ncbi:MAG: hypothetical protein ACYCU7_00715 [Acidimicrobiales bacterium]
MLDVAATGNNLSVAGWLLLFGVLAIGTGLLTTVANGVGQVSTQKWASVDKSDVSLQAERMRTFYKVYRQRWYTYVRWGFVVVGALLVIAAGVARAVGA